MLIFLILDESGSVATTQTSACGVRCAENMATLNNIILNLHASGILLNTIPLTI